MRKKRTTDYEDLGLERPRKAPISHLSVYFVVFAVALAVRIWFNFFDLHVNNYSAADAFEYLTDAGALVQLAHLPVSVWQNAIDVLMDKASPETVQAVQNAFAPAQGFRQAGPAFPAYLALCYAISGNEFNIASWMPPLAVQSFFSAATCLFTALIATRLFDLRTGLVAGLLAAFYPALIVSSGRLYSESFAATLLAMVCWIVCRGFSTQGNTQWHEFFAGLTAGVLQLTRSIMVVLSVALIPIIAIQRGVRGALPSIAMYVVGLALIILPWLGLQKLTFGKTNLMVDRVGNYNLAVGNNVETSGWLSFPYPDLSGIEQKSFTQLLNESVDRSPSKWLKLQLDKPARLFKFPWNDFKTSIGPVDHTHQVQYHQLLLLLASWGLAIGLAIDSFGRRRDFEERKLDDRAKHLGKIFILGVFALHLPYLAFITVPRYNLTSLPFIIIFAAAGLTGFMHLVSGRRGFQASFFLVLTSSLVYASQIVDLIPFLVQVLGADHLEIALTVQCILRTIIFSTLVAALWNAITVLTPAEREERTSRHPIYAKLIVGTLGMLLMFVMCVPLQANGRWAEWKATIQGPMKAVQMFRLSPAQASQLMQRQCFLAIDSTSAATVAAMQITINGQPLSGPVIPGIALVDDFEKFSRVGRSGFEREGEYIFDSMTAGSGISNSDLRQWFFIPVPVTVFSGKAEPTVAVEVQSSSPSVLYGAYDRGRQEVSLPSFTSCSWEKAFYGVESDAGLSDARYDTKIKTSAVEPQISDLSNDPGLQSGYYNIRLLLSPPTGSNAAGVFTVERFSSSSATEMSRLDIEPTVLSNKNKSTEMVKISDVSLAGKDDIVVVRVRGEVRVLDGDPKPGLQISAHINPDPVSSAQSKAEPLTKYVSPWVPRSLPATSNWSLFDVSVPVQPGNLPGQFDHLEVALQAQSSRLPKYSLPLEHEGAAEFRNVQVQLIRLPSRPVAPGHEVL